MRAEGAVQGMGDGLGFALATAAMVLPECSQPGDRITWATVLVCNALRNREAFMDMPEQNC